MTLANSYALLENAKEAAGRYWPNVEGEVFEERLKQEMKWGEQDHSPERWHAILSEEIGEIAKAILEDDKTNLQEELIQAAAVIFAWRQAQLRKEQSGNLGK